MRNLSKQQIERFWGAVAVGNVNECWLWERGRKSHPRNSVLTYGVFCLGKNKLSAHRVSWELSRGKIPEGMKVLHRCDVTNCVNPHHLFIGTQADNVHDMHSKGRDRKVNGEQHYCHKLTEAQVAEIRVRYIPRGPAYGNASKLAHEFGVHRRTVIRIGRGAAWRHVQ